MKNFKSVNIDAVNESSKDWLENDQQANVFTANNALLVNKINEEVWLGSFTKAQHKSFFKILFKWFYRLMNVELYNQ